MSRDSFMNLVNENNGFEVVLANDNDVNYCMGGKDNKYWFEKKKGNYSEYYMSTYENGTWNDRFLVSKKGKIVENTPVDSEMCINRIVKKAYYCQDKIGERTTKEVVKDNDAFRHYVFGCGEKSWDVSSQYGVTTGFSNIFKDQEGYFLKDINVGQDVIMPKEK